MCSPQNDVPFFVSYIAILEVLFLEFIAVYCSITLLIIVVIKWGIRNLFLYFRILEEYDTKTFRELYPSFANDPYAQSYLNEVDASMSDYLKSMFDTPPKCIQASTTTPAPTCPPLQTCPPHEPIKCVADFGTNIGDKLSGGQGVLQNTRHVCPNTLKKCSNFKCGSAFGTCTN
jgi:hypothetical protein